MRVAALVFGLVAIFRWAMHDPNGMVLCGFFMLAFLLLIPKEEKYNHEREDSWQI